MSDSARLETIEIKLAHLERSLQELGQAVMHQQNEIAALVSRNRALQHQLETIEQSEAPSAGPFEKPPHY
jgi:SlyX protein